MSTAMQTVPGQGRLARWKSAWLGNESYIDRTMRETEAQGARFAHLAHLCAGVLIVLFSLASLVALGGEALNKAINDAQHHTWSLSTWIALGVSLLIVPAADIALLYACNSLRIIYSRDHKHARKAVHYFVIIGVCLIETLTYGFMSYMYDNPGQNYMAWGLIVLRATSAPLLGMYLAMSRTLPVTGEDILHVASVLSARRFLESIMEVTGRSDTSLVARAALFKAATPLKPETEQRINALMEAAITYLYGGVVPGVVVETTLAHNALPDPNTDPTPPRGPNSLPRKLQGAFNAPTGGKVVALASRAGAPANSAVSAAAQVTPGIPANVQKVQRFLLAKPKMSITELMKLSGLTEMEVRAAVRFIKVHELPPVRKTLAG